jgi:predicted HTH transcriptional regulator
MTNEEFAQVIQFQHETRGVEFKGPALRSDTRLFAQIAKAVLGMSNRRGGGFVIIGVATSGQGLNPLGLTETEVASWTYDETAAALARYADPSVAFDLEVKEYNGRRYAVLQVVEFAEIPILCKRAYNTILRSGACYVRTNRMPETSEIPSQTEMRELLNLATEKSVRAYLESLRRVGLVDLPSPGQTSTGMFRQQRGDLDE